MALHISKRFAFHLESGDSLFVFVGSRCNCLNVGFQRLFDAGLLESLIVGGSSVIKQLQGNSSVAIVERGLAELLCIPEIRDIGDNYCKSDDYQVVAIFVA